MESMIHDYFPTHRECLLWNGKLILLHGASDVVIMLSYYLIPIALLAIVYHYRKEAAHFKKALAIYGTFIFFCGTTHLMGFIQLWAAHPWADGVIKAITAGVSIYAAIYTIARVRDFFIIAHQFMGHMPEGYGMQEIEKQLRVLMRKMRKMSPDLSQ